VVIDLKLGPFKAEFAGKMNLYVNAVNALITHPEDRATSASSSAPAATRQSPT
jgi:hypothetical protein